MWNENNFCDADTGFDYIFGVMNAIYGSRFVTHWQDVEPALVRQIWKEKLGVFLTYKPSMDFALKHLDADFPPSAIKFRDFCNFGPEIPRKPPSDLLLTKQKTQAEIDAGEKVKAEALAKLAALRKQFGGKNEN
jgi:hypothetical protein